MIDTKPSSARKPKQSALECPEDNNQIPKYFLIDLEHMDRYIEKNALLPLGTVRRRGKRPSISTELTGIEMVEESACGL